MARRPPVQQEDAVVRPRPLARRGHLPAPDQSHVGDGVVRGPERAAGDDGGTPTRQAGDAVDAGGLQRCRPARRRQDGGKATRQYGWERRKFTFHLMA